MAGQDQSLKIGKTGVELLAKGGVPLKLTVGDSSSMVFDGKGAITIKGSEITLDATKSVIVKAMDKVELTATNSVAVQGTKVSVKANATASFEATGITEVKGAMVKIN